MPDTGIVQSPQTIPDAAQPVQGVPGSRATFFLRSTPKVFTVIAAGASNQDFQIAAVAAYSAEQRVLDSRVFGRIVGLTNPIELSGLVHTRGQGSPQVNPQLRITGLDHAKVLGTLVVSTPPEPPEPPVPPPIVSPTPTPRNLRYVRRRNVPRER